MKMKAIAVFASAALVAPMAATAQDEAPAFDLSVSGHIARIVQHVSGPGSESRATPAGTSFQHKDAGVSGSRFRVTGSEELGNGLTAGVHLEYAAIAPSLRHAAVSLGGNFGSLNMGHTAPATNGSNDDLSASSLAVDMACSDAAMASCPDFTTGRQGVIRYNTPGGGPVGGAFAVGSGLWDGQISASGQMAGGASYALRASYADMGNNHPSVVAVPPTGTPGSTFSLAAAVKFQSVSLSTLWGKISPDGSAADTKGYGVKLGYDIGANSGVGVLYRSTDRGGTADPKTWGFGAQHNIGDLSLFTGYYIADPDDGTASTKSFNVGSRLTFN